MIFIDNKYTRWYIGIITTSQSRMVSLAVYTEIHHIIPKSLGGSNSKNNLVKLTAKEHFVCHRLLTKMTDGMAKRKMIYAQNMMLSKNSNQHRHLTNSRLYAKIKEEFNKINPFNDPVWQLENGKKMKGTKRTDQTKQNIRSSWTPARRKKHSDQGKGRKNPRTAEWSAKIGLANTGKTHKPRTAEFKQRQRVLKKGKPVPWKNLNKTCEHCNLLLNIGNYTQFHGENCPAKYGKLTNQQKVEQRRKKEKAVSIDGVIYTSLTEAGKALNLKICCLSYRVRKDSFPGYFFITG